VTTLRGASCFSVEWQALQYNNNNLQTIGMGQMASGAVVFDNLVAGLSVEEIINRYPFLTPSIAITLLVCLIYSELVQP